MKRRNNSKPIKQSKRRASATLKKQSSTATTQATTVVRQGPNNVIAAIAFQLGHQDYASFKPRPTVPTNENCDEPEAMRFYGWMMARSNDVMKIINDLRALNLSEKKHNALMNKRVSALDRAHSSDGRDHGPIW